MDILYSDSFSRNVAFTRLMFLPEISNRMVSVNGKHPLSPLQKIILKGASNRILRVCVQTGEVTSTLISGFLFEM